MSFGNKIYESYCSKSLHNRCAEHPSMFGVWHMHPQNPRIAALLCVGSRAGRRGGRGVFGLLGFGVVLDLGMNLLRGGGLKGFGLRRLMGFGSGSGRLRAMGDPFSVRSSIKGSCAGHDGGLSSTEVVYD